MSDKHIDFTFVVNGQSVPVVADTTWEFREAAAKALDESGNSGATDRELGNSRRVWADHRHGGRRSFNRAERKGRRCS